jgi:GNAT superfamily N-acetyltransferase
MDIVMLDERHPLWQKTADYAHICPWSAGPWLARMMKGGGIRGIERVFAACEGEDILGFCLFCEKDGLPERLSGFTPFAACVFVDEKRRGSRISQSMLEAVEGYARSLGYRELYLKSEHRGLYEKYGYRLIDTFEPNRGPADQLFSKPLADVKE